MGLFDWKSDSGKPPESGMFSSYPASSQSTIKAAMLADIIGNIAGRPVGAVSTVMPFAENARRLQLLQDQRDAVSQYASGMSPAMQALLRANPGPASQSLIAAMVQPRWHQLSDAELKTKGIEKRPGTVWLENPRTGELAMEGGAGITINQSTNTPITDRAGKIYAFPTRGGSLTPVIDPSTGQQMERPVSGEQPTGDDWNSYSFSERMDASSIIMDRLEQSFKAGQGESPYLTFGAKLIDDAIPLVGDTLQRGYQSKEQQLYHQAARNWITANIRKESGAAIPPGEVQDEYLKYFPMPNDTPEVIAQKADTRQIAARTMREAAGRARREVERRKRGEPGARSYEKQYGLERR